MSTRNHHQRVAALFDAALDKNPSDRETLLSRESNPEVRREAASLLDALEHANRDRTIARDLVEAELTRLQTTPSVGVDSRLANYRLIAQLGSGGMGVVYEAEQVEPERRVAIKLLPGGYAQGPDDERRFRSEASALGRMRHPHVAQVYEGGVHVTDADERIPFLAMELIPEALDLRSYAEQQQLTLPARLELFEQVCDAVHHAHLRGVLHCDLKPANVLVDPSGTAKVIDFGIARIVDGDDCMTWTQPGLGTLEYMSPEQCTKRSADLDLRVDVYALGVILYELLCDHRPLALSELPLTEALHRLANQIPVPPSDWNAEVAGDLEAILSVALAKTPESRYPSAAELRADIRRFQAHQPVMARHPGPVHRGRLFVRRHRAAVAMVSVVVAVLISAVAVCAGYALDARQRLSDLVRTDQFFRRTFAGNRLVARRDLLVSDLLDGIAVQIDDHFGDRDELRKRMLFFWGQNVRDLRDRVELQRIVERLDSLRNVALEGIHPARYETLAGYAWSRDDPARALRHLQAARELVQIETGEPELRATIYLNLLQLLLATGDVDAAEQLIESVEANDGIPTALSDQRASWLLTLGQLALKQSRPQESVDFLTRAVAILEIEAPTRTLASTLHQLGSLYAVQGEFATAAVQLERAITVHRELFPSSKPDPDLGIMWQTLSAVRFEQQLFTQAFTAIDAALLQFEPGETRHAEAQRRRKIVLAKLGDR